MSNSMERKMLSPDLLQDPTFIPTFQIPSRQSQGQVPGIRVRGSSLHHVAVTNLAYIYPRL